MSRRGPLLIILLLTILFSCQRNPSLVIEPINEEANEALLTGKNLDLRLYGTKSAFQYYQIDGYMGLSAKDLASKLDSFVQRRYPINKHRKSLAIWFYKKPLFSNYDDLVYQSARENENGSLTGHAEDVVALIDQEFPDAGERFFIRHIYIYYPKQSKSPARHDTVRLE